MPIASRSASGREPAAQSGPERSGPNCRDVLPDRWLSQAQVDFAHFEVEFDDAPGQRHIVAGLLEQTRRQRPREMELTR